MLNSYPPGIKHVHDKQGFLNAILRFSCLQHVWLLLLFCAGPRSNFFLRRVLSDPVMTPAQSHDNEIMQSCQKLIAIPGTNAESFWREQGRSTMRSGDLGLRSAVLYAPEAHWASWADYLFPPSSLSPSSLPPSVAPPPPVARLPLPPPSPLPLRCGPPGEPLRFFRVYKECRGEPSLLNTPGCKFLRVHN